MTSVIIPASVTNIEEAAFRRTNLTGVYFKGNAPSLPGGSSGLFSDDSQATVYYLAETTGWGKTFGGRPTAVWKPQATAGEVKVEKPFKYSCVRFDQKGKVVCEGTITAKQFHKWFEIPMNIGGLYFPTPSDATIFGVLVLTDGDKILTMPLQAWHQKFITGPPALRDIDLCDSEFLACRAYESSSPAFWVTPSISQLQDPDGKPLMKEVCSGTFTGAVQRVGLFFGKEPATRGGLTEEIKKKLIKISTSPDSDL